MDRVCSCLIIVAIAFAASPSVHADDDAKPQAPPKFELRDGDRVVFLGNTLIERAQKYGYWETMLTARYPDRDVTFRNLGWSGDTVWAESRGMFDPPEVGYQRMLEQIAGLKPTVIFVGYGNNEAFAGKEGLPSFIKQYNKLLDDLTRVSAEGVRFVVMSPVPLEHQDAPFPSIAEQNEKIQLYAESLKSIARQRGAAFLDLHSMLKLYFADSSGGLFSVGMHLNKGGYLTTRKEFLFLTNGTELGRSIVIDAKGKEPVARTNNVEKLMRTDDGVRFELNEENFAWVTNKLRVTGLSTGLYAIKIDGKSADGMAYAIDGGFDIFRLKTLTNVVLATGIEYEPMRTSKQKAELRQAIIEKNRLYFHRWRPQNVTYLFGFRKHEQGQNAKELEEFDRLIAEKEKEISRLKKPVPHTYEIIRLKEKPAQESKDE